MRKIFLFFLLAGLALSVFAAKDVHVAKATVTQLEEALAAARGKPDADVARQLSGLELTERLNMVQLAALKAALPGDKAREQLVILADSAAFLDPPGAEIPSDPTPDPESARKMLTLIVNYVNTTARQLPNFIAERDTIGFEDKPQEDELGPTGVTTVAAMPLHSIGKTSVTATYRDRKEVVDEKAAKHGAQIGGLTTVGEFGPILSLWWRMRLKARSPGAAGNKAQTERKRSSTMSSPAKSHISPCSSAALQTVSTQTAVRSAAFSGRLSAITARLTLIPPMDQSSASPWRQRYLPRSW
jgi:hypothetical protein